MTRQTHVRILGFLALLALSLHSGEIFGHEHDSWLDTDCLVCHWHQLKVLEAASSGLQTQQPLALSTVAQQAPTVAWQTPLACHLSRGPPA